MSKIMTHIRCRNAIEGIFCNTSSGRVCVAFGCTPTQQRKTARAIREAAGVSMAVAAATARAWNESQGPEDVPPVPEAVQLRLAGVWREAVAASRS